jgi:hypothetical protein
MSPCVHHVDLLVVGIACDLPTDPNWKRKLGRLRRKLDFSQDYAVQYPLVDIDLPCKPTVRDEISGLCKLATKAMVGDQLLGIGSGYFILKFCICQTFRLRLHGQSGSLIANPDTHLAAIGDCDQPVPDLLLPCRKTPPAFVTHQELSFNLDGHVFPRCPG